jgi:hypothetical protein
MNPVATPPHPTPSLLEKMKKNKFKFTTWQEEAQRRKLGSYQ